MVCSLKAPQRFLVFAWLMLLNRILTIDNLVIKEWSMVNRCVMCKKESETVKHLILKCQVAKRIHGREAARYRISIRNMINTTTVHPLLNRSLDKKARSIFLITSFVIWRERCLRIFTDKECEINELVRQVQEQWRRFSNGGYQLTVT